MRPPAITDEMRELFLGDYQKIGSVTGLAAKWGVDRRTARSALRRFGASILTKPLGEYHPKLGVWSDARVAEDMGVTKQAVHQARHQRGLPSALERAMSILNEE